MRRIVNPLLLEFAREEFATDGANNVNSLAEIAVLGLQFCERKLDALMTQRASGKNLTELEAFRDGFARLTEAFERAGSEWTDREENAA